VLGTQWLKAARDAGVCWPVGATENQGRWAGTPAASHLWLTGLPTMPSTAVLRPCSFSPYKLLSCCRVGCPGAAGQPGEWNHRGQKQGGSRVQFVVRCQPW
jgi:hypothetical protein